MAMRQQFAAVPFVFFLPAALNKAELFQQNLCHSFCTNQRPVQLCMEENSQASATATF